MLKNSVLLAAVVALVACSDRSAVSAPPMEMTNPMSVEDRNEVWAIRMQERVRERLKDPKSAEFKDARTHHGGGAPVVCGQVNSKNSMGGYGGFQRFIAAGDLVVLEEETEAGAMNEIWKKYCVD